MKEKLEKIKEQFDQEISKVKNNAELELLKIKYLGRKAEFNALLSTLKDLSAEEKQVVGRIANDVKKYIAEKIDSKQNTSYSNSVYDNIDVTLPGKDFTLGTLHPHTIVTRQMNEIFKQMGFSVYAGPEIETDEYVFEKLNLPKNHPARSLQDTLIIDDPEVILRSHTSSVEMRALENDKLPIRIVAPGRVFRYETLNQTNHFAFYQYEGLAVGEDITMADLKGAFESFARSFFGPETVIRIRAKYYPQVEPGCGLDILCKFCDGKGCPVCKKRGWIEASGGGMVHPNALRSCGIDPEKYSGFAWGIGFDRVVMQKFGIADIRKLFDGTLI
jgi:phenylalanyl-tRNA synthetase alpha chain